MWCVIFLGVFSFLLYIVYVFVGRIIEWFFRRRSKSFSQSQESRDSTSTSVYLTPHRFEVFVGLVDMGRGPVVFSFWGEPGTEGLGLRVYYIHISTNLSYIYIL